MEPPDEADEDIQMKKEEGNQSSKTLGITSPEKEKANQRNGTPAKPRQNPFNSGGLQDSTDYGNQTPNLNQVNGTAKTKADIISSLSKYGVKLPYPELTKGSQISQKAEDYSQQQASDDSQQQAVQTPVPKPRTLKTNNAPQDQTGSSIRTEDSFNGTSKPRGILKRRSSTSSTDSESIRLCQSAESSKIVSSGSTILEAGQDNFFDEHNTATDNSTDRLKQVRFSEKVHQRPPTPNPEPYSSIEIGEYGILDPGLSRDYLFNGFGDHHVSEEPLSEQGRYFTVDSDDAKILETNTLESQDISIRTQPASLEVERNLVEPEEEMSHINDQLRLVPSPDISIELPTNDSTGEEPMYAVVNKTPKVSSSSQDKDFDLDDALVDLQRGKTITAYQSERPLEFWKSYGGEGKIAFDSSYPEMQLKEKYSFSNEDENIATTYSNVENSPSITTQPDYNFESVASWRQPSLLRDQEQRPPSLDFTREKRTTHILQDVPIVKDPSAYVQNLPYVKYSPGEYSSETRYRSMFLQKDEDGPDGLKNNLPVAQNGQSPLKSGQTQYTFLRENKGRRDLPKSANFKVMSWSERINVVPDEQMSNPSQFQSLKHFWNVEEKNPVIGDTDISPNKLLTDFMSRNKSTKAERQQRNSREVSAEEVNLPNTFASLSEEEQTSQKVASWLAHTPAMEEVDQMHHVEDHPYPEDVTLEHVQKSTVADKTEKSATARQKPRVEIYEAPRIIEAGKLMNEDIQDVPQEKQNLMNHQQTTIAVSPVSQTSLETKPPDFKMSNQAFYDRILQMSKKQSPVKETMPPKKRPSEGDQERASVPVKSASEHIVGFQKRQEEYDFAPAEEFQEMHQPSAGKTEEVVEKSVAPESRDKQDFISALNKLETEAFNSPLEAETEAVIEKSNAPESQDKQDFISALKKLEIEAFNSPLEAETEEVIEKSNAPESQDKQDFITALNKLEIEASNLSLLNTEAEHQDNLPEEEIQQHTVSSVNSSFKIGFENFIPADNAYESEMSYEIPSKDQSVQFQSLQTYPHNKENSIEVVHDLGETVEKTTVPRQKDEELGNALRKLELEAIEDQPVEVLVHVNNNVDLLVHVNNNVDLQSPMTLQAEFLEDHSDVEDSSFRDELEQSPNASSVFQQISHPDIKEQNQPVVDEKPIQRVIVETQESNADFYSRLMRLEEEAATIPEEPEDLLEDDTIKVSQFPNREVLITKKVYSSIESLPPVDYPQENETSEETAFYSPRIKSKELNDLKSQELAINHSFPSVLYKKPEVGSPEVSNSKQGMADSHPILSALKRSTAKQLKTVEEVPPTSTNHLNSSNPEEHITVPTENTFPDNAEKFKRMSQSVPTFLQDETDGRDTDSASESSFQLGRHRKSPSSLTNLSGSSGMASMSSVSGSVMSVYSGDFGNVDVRGSIELSIDYVEQLKEFLIYVYQCKGLAVADVKRQRSDPYVKAYLLPEKAKMGKRKTAVKKKTLNPVYNEILRYKIPKQSLLAQTLNLSVWHHDALGRNSFLGEVNVKLATWNWNNTPRGWYDLEPRTPAAGIGLENRGEMKLALKYVPMSPQGTGSKPTLTGEVHIWIKECLQLPMLRENKISSFVKCTVLPDTSRKSRQKTRTVDKTTSPIFNHTMVYDGFKHEDLREACVELTVWDHTRLSNHFLGGLRVGLGTGKSYGTPVDWMDSTHEESTMWEKMMSSPDTWIEGLLPLRMFKMAKLSK